MSTVTADERRRSFNQMVELYARARPAPPPELFDAVATYVPPPADVLEIGCGPGNASLPLLERGFRIHAVELGENLAAFARQRLAAFAFTVFVNAPEQAMEIDVIDVFRFDADGKVAEMRAFWGPGNVRMVG